MTSWTFPTSSRASWVTASREADRRAELVTRVGALRARLVNACCGAGRDPGEVTVIAVTKTFPASDVATLATLGVLDIGENRDQEARAKIAELKTIWPDDSPVVRWHFVGRLQSNKARRVAGYAHAVHSVDRVELADALATAVSRLGRPPLDVFVQVSLDADPTRGGVVPAELRLVADAVAAREQLRFVGLMAVAPMDSDPDQAFARLAEYSAHIQETYPFASAISAGMSGDLEQAVAHGATHVRVGSALLGHRGPAVG
jgi:PLP dependent protein